MLIGRHGERERLSKHPTSLAEGSDGGPSLTAAGVEHIARVGAALRERYLSPESCGDHCLNGALGAGGFSPDELRADSSGLARTLGTAEVLLNALVPPAVRGSMPIAVYSRPDAEDWLLRGYTQCPALAEQIGTWHASADFAAKDSRYI